MKHLSLALATLLLAIATHAQELQLEEHWWQPNGPVNAIVKDEVNNIVYLGGDFTHIGPNVPYGSSLDATTGAPDLAFAKPNGAVNATIPDGGGGWFIGGSFTQLGGQTRNGLARLNADGSLHPWDPGCNGTVIALELEGGVLYIGGNFSQVGGQPRGNVAALDAVTGSATAWDPNASSGVHALAVIGSTVYAGGDFTSIGGQTRNYIAALDATTGTATAWNPDANNWVRALAASGSTVYAGGFFTSIGGQPRNRIAALDAVTGSTTAWDPNGGDIVWTLAVSGTTVYAGGNFTSIGGQPRSRIAALDAITGDATAWNPNASSAVLALALSGSTVYVGGDFTSVGGQPRNRIAALDATTGNATAWDPIVSNQVLALAVNGTTVYAGGSFTSIGGQTRNRIAALDATTGLATAWDPNASSSVNALALSGTTVYAGGGFTSIGGQTRNRIAALDATTGTATAWNPSANSTVRALAISGTTVYAGGQFTSIGGQTRSRIAALDATINTNNATAWNPNAVGTVMTLAVSGSTVYAGGEFINIGGQSRSRIAALDASTGNATGWDPNAGGTVNALAVSGNTIFAGGGFSSIGGQALPRIAALDINSGMAINSNAPSFAVGTTYALASDADIAYFGGIYAEVVGSNEGRVGKLDMDQDAVSIWDVGFIDGGGFPIVNSIVVDGSQIYVGGNFTSVGEQARRSFAVFSPCEEQTWYADLDGDGFGDPSVSQLACEQPLGYVADNTDCNDNDADVFPGAPCTTGDACITDETLDTNCNCTGGTPLPDSDNDGICDDEDVCPLAVEGIANFDENTCACALGYFATITDIGGNDVITDCTICPPGTYCPDGINAVPCAAGTFSDQPGLSACAPCAAGFANGSLGQTSCQACPPGRFSDVQAATVCSLCPANTYNPDEAQSECLACPSGESSGEGATECVPDGALTDVNIELRTPDGSSDEISWEIVTLSSSVVCQGGSYSSGISTPIVEGCSLSDGCYRLRVFDSAGDGFGAGGGYQLRLTGSNPADLRIIDNLGNFTDTSFPPTEGTLSAIGGGPNAFCFPMSTQKPIFVAREKLDWVNAQYFVSEPDDDVSAQWQVGDQTLSGYQFWFFDPNGTYSFRRGRNHATSDNFGPANEFRACHMRINNWAVANQIPQNVLMNVRIRARVAGVYKDFGPAYQFKIDPVRAQCPLTKLNDIPDQQYLSCNSTRNFGPGNWVHARQVSGANRYQFRFRIASEGFSRVIASNTYFLQLNWTTLPLVAGKTYDVDVRASKDGGATWCTSGVLWGHSCTLTIGGGAHDQEQNLGLGNTTNGSLALWPNPNRGGQLWIDLSGIEASVGAVAVDIFDMTGKQIVTRILPTQGDHLNTVLDLQGDLATGMYLLNITAGDKRYTERLVIAN